MRHVALATGVELAVLETGHGEPVVLLHAWGETHRSFDRLIPLLPPSMHLVVPDQRGVGESTKPTDGYSLHDSGEDIVALLDALGLEACWFVGTSSGGYLAQQVAVEHPDRVRGLVLIGAPSDLHRPLPVSLADLLASFHDPVTRDDILALNGVLPLHSPVPDAFLEDQLIAALSIPKAVWVAVADGLFAAEPPLRLGPITVPTLILWGAEDRVLPAEQPHELVAAIDGSRLELYEDTGHLVLWERPDRVAADMIAYLTERQSRPSAGQSADR